MRISSVLIVWTVLVIAGNADAGGRRGGGGGGGGGRGSSHVRTAPSGTGSSSRSVSVRGYTKKNGTHVAPARRSAGDGTQRNNYTTKGNTNPFNGKRGTRDSRR